MAITIEDLIKAGKSEVRYNSNLLTAYKELFAEKFGREPVCAGCTFDSDWNRLINNQNSTKTEIMSDKTFKLRDNSIIYSFDRADKKTKRMMRSRMYGNIMTEKFAEDYLTHGSEEQIAERKKQFKVLPKKFQANDDAPADLIPEKLADMKALAAEKGYPAEEYASINTKADMKAYLEGKELAAKDSEEDEDDKNGNLIDGKTVTVGSTENQANDDAPAE